MHSRGNMNDIVISIHPEYVNKILTGEKSIELRRRRMNISVGTRIWIYSTLPHGKIVATASICNIEETTPAHAWKAYSKNLCINHEQYHSYTEKSDSVYLLHLNDLRELTYHIPLSKLRSVYSKFQPPQFFMRADCNLAIARLLKCHRSFKCISKSPAKRQI